MMNRVEYIAKELKCNFDGNRRYNTIIFVTDAPTSTAMKQILEFAHSVEKKLLEVNIPCEIIDFFGDVVSKGEFPLGDTGNSFNELIDWLKRKAKPPMRCLLIYEVDPLLSTWNNIDNIKAFFKKLLYHDGIVIPVLLISHIAGKFSLPTNPMGQGLVINESYEEVQ